MSSNKKGLIYLTLLFVLIFIPVFAYINYLPIRLWDESRLAINALEMYYNKNYFVTHYMNQPDLWNTKPPLLIWLQVTSFHLFGINEFAFRFPSVIANFIVLLSIITFSIKYQKNIWIGIFWVLVYLTSQGLINVHSTRTGDYDMLLSLFNFLYLVCFYLFIKTKKTKFLYRTFAFITLSVLTKSIAGLLFIPALFLFSLYKKQVFNILKNKHFYFALISSVIIIISYYAIREYNSKGYIDAVFANELGGRFLKINENHNEAYWFYADDLINSRFNNWFLFIPFGIILAFFVKSKRLKDFSIYLIISILSFMLIISISKTKLAWYDFPLRLLISFFISISIYYISKYISNLKFLSKYKLLKIILPVIFVFVLFFKPYSNLLKSTYKPKEYVWDIKKFEISYFLRDALHDKINLANTYYVNNRYNPQNLFYLKLLQKKGVKIKKVKINEINIGDKVIFVDYNDLKKIKKQFITERVFEKYNIKIIKIKSKKA